MKATFKSMMVIGMMILGTTTSFASSNTAIDKNHNTPKKECHLRHIHDSHCGGMSVADKHCVYPGMDKKLRNHIIKGNHKFNHSGVCKKCNMTMREIQHVERGMEINRHGHKR